jgi:hypothetical protein
LDNRKKKKVMTTTKNTKSAVQLYDLTKGDFPLDQRFRSLQVHKCSTCDALTNHALWINGFMCGARFLCQNENSGWHRKIQAKRGLLFSPHPKAYVNAMQEEIEEILRSSNRKDDIVGDADPTSEADAQLHEGFIVHGIGFWPGGRKRIVGAFFQNLHPPLVERVFSEVSRGQPAEIVTLLLTSLVATHEFHVSLEAAERDDDEAARERLGRSGSELRRIHLCIPDSATEKIIDDLKSRYRGAYEQWLAENRLAEVQNGNPQKGRCTFMVASKKI